MKHVLLFFAGSFGKWSLAITLTLLSYAPALAQGLGIGTTAPDVSAALDIVSSNKGALLPRVANVTAIATPATGLLVFQTGGTPGFYYNAGTPAVPDWQQIATAAGAAITASNGLTKTGQDIALGGTLTQATTVAAGSNTFSLTQTGTGLGTPATDQNTLAASSSSYLNGTNYQTVTAGVTGILTQVELRQGFNTGATSNFTLTIRNGAGTGGAVLYTAGVSFVGTGGQTQYSYPITGVSLTAGQVFTIQVAGGATNWSYNTTNAYAGGAAGFNAGNDFLFRTTMQPYLTVAALTATGGNVGIGTSAPTQKLEVNGEVFSNTGGFRFPDNTVQTTAATTTPATTASNGLTKTGNDIALGGTLTGATDINTNGNNLTLSGAGNLGIGTTAAPTRLTIAPLTLEPKITLYEGSGGINYYGLGISNLQLNYHVGSNAGSHVFYAGGNNGNGTELLRMQNNGNVGIGTATPAQKLDVTGNTNVTGNSYVSGNVGIGNVSPAAKLHVSGNLRADLANGAFTLNNFGPTGAETVLLGTFSGTSNNAPQLRFSGVGTTLMDIGQDSSGAFVVEGNDSPRLTVQRLGNVGIGTTTPAGKLDIQGGADNNGNNNPGGLALSYRNGGYRHFVRSRHNSAVTGNGNDLDFYLNNSTTAAGSSAAGTGNIQVLTLESNNSLPRVGIGTTAPAATLEVSGAASTVRLGGLAGTGTRLVTVDASGNLSSSAGLPAGVTGDNLGNHTATTTLNLQGNALTGTGASIGAVVGLGIRADGGLNLGQNTSNNLFVGYLAGAATTPGGGLVGTNNLFAGVRSGRDNTTGAANTFVGYETGRENETGSYNTFTGHQSGLVNTTGGNNAFTGNQSGFSNTDGDNNTFMGTQSGRNTTTGDNNTFFGSLSGRENVTGSNNTVLGASSGPAVGSGALTNATAVGANVPLTTSNTVVLGNNANVGIGTSAPNSRLSLSPGALEAKITLWDGGSTTNHAGFGQSNSQLNYHVPDVNNRHVFYAGGKNGNGTELLRIQGDGLVGIGTNSPSATLDVNGSTRLRGLTTAGVVTTDASGNLSSVAGLLGDNLGDHVATQNLDLAANQLVGNGGTTGLMVSSGGNVGIGTTAPATTLDVRTGDNSAAITVGMTDNTAGALYLGNSAHGLKRNYNATNDVGLYTTAGSVYLSANGTSAGQFMLTNGGNVGIGIGNSGQATSRLWVRAADNSTAAIASFLPLNQSQGVILTYQGIAKTGTNLSSDLTLDGKSVGNILLHTSGSTGNVGIGTNLPGAKLHVAGDVKIDGTNTLEFGAGVAGKEANAGKIGYQAFSTALDIVGAGTTSGNRTIRFWAEGGAVFTGSVTGVGAFNTSDARFKQNVRPLGGALASVLALRGVRYEWNTLGVQHGGKAGEGQVGLIAQEIEQIYPELVTTDADGYKAVNYAQLAPVLIEALKEQQAQIDALKQQNATDKAQASASLESLAARLRALEAGSGQARK